MFRNNRLLLLYLLTVILPGFAAQKDSSDIQFPVTIDEIVLSGNNITRPEVVMRELTVKVGDAIDSVSLIYNKERIFSLGIFNKVVLKVEKQAERHILNIAVEETWYIWPLPYISRNEKDWNKLTFGLDLTVYNFRGRNEKIKAVGGLGYDPFISLSYTIPYLFEDAGVSAHSSIEYKSRKNRSAIADTLFGKGFNQKVITYMLNVEKRLELFHRFQLYGGYSYVETPDKYVSRISVSGSRIDRYPFFGLSYIYDTRDLTQYASSGTFVLARAQANGIGVNNINYRTYFLDVRQYAYLTGKLRGKIRFATRHSYGDNVPLYDRAFLGLDDRIRGNFHVKKEADAIAIGSAELFYPIIEEWNLKFNLPMIPERLTRYRVALYTHIFVDSGITRNIGEPYMLKNMMTGYGFGFTFMVLPFNAGRVELGFNEKGESELIIDVGVSF